MLALLDVDGRLTRIELELLQNRTEEVVARRLQQTIFYKREREREREREKEREIDRERKRERARERARNPKKRRKLN